MPLTDEILMAYADGELEPERLAGVEAALAADTLARARLALFRDSAQALRAAYAGIASEPVPPELIARALGGRLANDAAAPDGRARTSPGRRGAWAAALALLVAGGVGLGLWRAGTPEPAEIALAGPGVAALERAATGALIETEQGRLTPLLTFRDHRDRICREFEHLPSTGSDVLRGIACRGDGGWQTVAAVVEPLVEAGQGFSPAAGDRHAIELLVEAMAKGPPFGPDAEAALLSHGWQLDG